MESQGNMFYQKRESILSQEEKIALEIYKYNYVKKEQIYFSKLTELFNGKISRVTISKVIDRLFDLGMISASWEDHGGWIRSLYISGEYKEFFKDLYNNIYNMAYAVEA
ncbi:MAG TPA: hypothetical protein VFD03_07120 [Clostridia bacterium]|nr:hypothetical protein [Clostridia bacterium]